MRFLVAIMALVVGLASLGVGYAFWYTTREIDVTVSTGNIGLDFASFSCSDVPGQADLGTDKDVAFVTCELVDTDGNGVFDALQIEVFNAYPGFQLLVEDITLHGGGSVPVHITDTSIVFDDGPLNFTSSPGVLGLEGFWTDTNLVCKQIHLGDTVSASLWFYVSVNQVAEQNSTYTVLLSIDSAQWNETDCKPGVQDLGGTPGFWKNWDSHGTYASTTILGWLANISSTSAWLGPTTIDGMESALDFSKKAPMEDKFLGHYLATSLNIEAGRLDPSVTHDFSSLDPTDYLGLGGFATLSAIVAAIEGKSGTGPDDDQLEIMKDICDASTILS